MVQKANAKRRNNSTNISKKVFVIMSVDSIPSPLPPTASNRTIVSFFQSSMTTAADGILQKCDEMLNKIIII